MSDVIRDIFAGEHDDILSSISDAIRERSKTLARDRAAMNRILLRPGARVRLKGLSPKYLNGRLGTVVENVSRHKSAIAVKQDRHGISAGDIETIHVPAQCVEAID